MTFSNTKVAHTMSYFSRVKPIVAALSILAWAIHESQACTGITLKAKDGAVVYGRTMEWGSFDLNSRLVIVPRGFKFTGHTPDEKQGMTWNAKFGLVGLDAVEKDMVVDGMNERGSRWACFIIRASRSTRSMTRPAPPSRCRRRCRAVSAVALCHGGRGAYGDGQDLRGPGGRARTRLCSASSLPRHRAEWESHRH